MLHFDLVHAVLLGIDPGRKCVGDQIIVWRKMNIVHICKLRGLFGNVWIWCFYLALTDASSVPHNGTGVFCCHLISFLHYPCHYFYGPFVLHLRHFFLFFSCSSRPSLFICKFYTLPYYNVAFLKKKMNIPLSLLLHHTSDTYLSNGKNWIKKNTHTEWNKQKL